MGKGWLMLLICLNPCMLIAQSPIDKNMSIDTAGQKDLIDIGRSIIKSPPRPVSLDEKKRIYFSFLPVSTSVPGGGSALVTSTTAGIYLGDRNTTYLSSITFTPYFNFKSRYGLPVRS